MNISQYKPFKQYSVGRVAQSV